MQNRLTGCPSFPSKHWTTIGQVAIGHPWCESIKECRSSWYIPTDLGRALVRASFCLFSVCSQQYNGHLPSIADSRRQLPTAMSVRTTNEVAVSTKCSGFDQILGGDQKSPAPSSNCHDTWTSEMTEILDFSCDVK